jgi:hypothetical protein
MPNTLAEATLTLFNSLKRPMSDEKVTKKVSPNPDFRLLEFVALRGSGTTALLLRMRFQV